MTTSRGGTGDSPGTRRVCAACSPTSWSGTEGSALGVVGDRAGWLTRESGRAQAYYAELIRELEERRAGSPPASPEQARLDSKLLAVGREREGRLAELRAKYCLSAEISLLSVLRLYLPRVVFAGTLADKRREAALALTWDPIEHTGEPARCSRCDGLTYEVGLHRGGGVACPRCLDAGRGGSL